MQSRHASTMARDSFFWISSVETDSGRRSVYRLLADTRRVREGRTTMRKSRARVSRVLVISMLALTASAPAGFPVSPARSPARQMEGLAAGWLA